MGRYKTIKMKKHMNSKWIVGGNYILNKIPHERLWRAELRKKGEKGWATYTLVENPEEALEDVEFLQKNYPNCETRAVEWQLFEIRRKK